MIIGDLIMSSKLILESAQKESSENMSSHEEVTFTKKLMKKKRRGGVVLLQSIIGHFLFRTGIASSLGRLLYFSSSESSQYILRRDRLKMGYFDNLANVPLNKYKKKIKIEKSL
jgi:hypothetical protein